MRRILVVAVLAGLFVTPTWAQFRGSVPGAPPPARLYDVGGKVGTFLNKMFNPNVFSMSHSFEMSTGSFGGEGYSMGMYTNTMAWKFSDKFAASVSVAAAYSPQNNLAQQVGFVQQGPKVFLRNAELAWRPSEKVHVQLQIRQDPYGYRNMGYYGYGPYGGYRTSMFRRGWWY